jgi:N-methylhydantoinase B
MPNERRYPKVDFLRLDSGDRLELISSGDGGYGDPLDRHPDNVARDVAYGYVSRDKAEQAYGVVLQDGTTYVDQEATNQRRSELKERRPRAGDSTFDFGSARTSSQDGRMKRTKNCTGFLPAYLFIRAFTPNP